MRKIVLLAILVSLTSCLSLRRQDYTVFESFQIGNSSSDEITLHFYNQGQPKIVYYELYDQSSLITVSRDSSIKEQSSMMSDSILTLAAQQSALLYSNENQWNPGTRVSCLYECGGGYGQQFYVFFNRKFFVGDSVVISSAETEGAILPLTQNELWETWYDEKNFIYYHLWRIE